MCAIHAFKHTVLQTLSKRSLHFSRCLNVCVCYFSFPSPKEMRTKPTKWNETFKECLSWEAEMCIWNDFGWNEFHVIQMCFFSFRFVVCFFCWVEIGSDIDLTCEFVWTGFNWYCSILEPFRDLRSLFKSDNKNEREKERESERLAFILYGKLL